MEIYMMRHGQKEFGSADPSLTERGRIQIAEASQKYLTGIDFDAIYRGIYIRHVETAGIAKVTLGIARDIIETPLLSSTNAMHEAGNRCAIAGRNHPRGPAVGFLVSTWIEMNPTFMFACAEQLLDFFSKIPETAKTILAISSCPIVEAATLNPENTRLIGDCGIIKYVIKGSIIVSSEIIFSGFFEK